MDCSFITLREPCNNQQLRFDIAWLHVTNNLYHSFRSWTVPLFNLRKSWYKYYVKYIDIYSMTGFLLQFYKHRTTVQYKTISIRQFVLSNFVLSDRQIEDHKVIWTKVGELPLENFEKIRPQILHSESLCQCSNLFKKPSFFTRSNQKVVNFIKINLYTDSLVQTRNSQHKMVRQT